MDNLSIQIKNLEREIDLKYSMCLSSIPSFIIQEFGSGEYTTIYVRHKSLDIVYKFSMLLNTYSEMKVYCNCLFSTDEFIIEKICWCDKEYIKCKLRNLFLYNSQRNLNLKL